jgi:hypothetical protein
MTAPTVTSSPQGHQHWQPPTAREVHRATLGATGADRMVCGQGCRLRLLDLGFPWIVVGALLVWVPSAGAVLFHATDDPDHNTEPPGGSLAGSGWDLQGFWGAYLGTPVAAGFFLTAQHVGGVVGDPFVWNGVSYNTVAFHDHAGSDLRLVRICGEFSQHAPLHDNRNEIGKEIVVFGRGTRRGAQVVSDGPIGTRIHGWRWGASDGRLRWGRNVVESVVPGEELFSGRVGDLLRMTFDPDGGPDECHLSVGDSGGAVFLEENGVWQLAGLNYAVDGPYRLDAEGPAFNAAILDEGGLEKQRQGLWLSVPPLPIPQPGGFCATRISSHIHWIQSVLDQPWEPGATLVLESGPDVSGPYMDESAANIDLSNQTITLPTPSQTRFYRIRSCTAARIVDLHVEVGLLVMTYEWTQGSVGGP